jgi:hypothetical protein
MTGETAAHGFISNGVSDLPVCTHLHTQSLVFWKAHSIRVSYLRQCIRRGLGFAVQNLALILKNVTIVRAYAW